MVGLVRNMVLHNYMLFSEKKIIICQICKYGYPESKNSFVDTLFKNLDFLQMMLKIFIQEFLFLADAPIITNSWDSSGEFPLYFLCLCSFWPDNWTLITVYSRTVLVKAHGLNYCPFFNRKACGENSKSRY